MFLNVINFDLFLIGWGNVLFLIRQGIYKFYFLNLVFSFLYFLRYWKNGCQSFWRNFQVLFLQSQKVYCLGRDLFQVWFQLVEVQLIFVFGVSYLYRNKIMIYEESLKLEKMGLQEIEGKEYVVMIILVFFVEVRLIIER